MRTLSRRGFLRRTAAVGLTAGTAKCLTGCGANPLPFIPQPTDAPVDDVSRVVAVRGMDLTRMTRETLEGVGGMASIVNPDETVFIKANYGGLGFVGGDPVALGESVKPEIVAVVAEECLKAGASRVTVGEAGQVRVIPWERARTLDGSTNLVAEVQRLNATYAGQVDLVSLMVDSPGWEAVPSPRTSLGDIEVTSLMTQADRVISVAVIKSHRWAHMTGSLKNFVGTTSFDPYGYGVGWRFVLHNTAGGVVQCFLDIVNAIEPDLAIIDGSICCEGNGPHVMPGWWGDTVDVSDRLGDWFMLGSTDLAAADATAARIIGLDVADVEHLVRAYAQGIGQIHADKIQLDGATLDELQIQFEPADHTVGFNEVILPGFMLSFFSG